MKPLARLIVFLLVAGAAFGAWRLFQKQGGKTPTFAIPGITPANSNSASSGTKSSGSAAPLTLITSATKKGWLEKQVERFNAEKGRNVQIRYIETRDALQAIVNNKEKPTLWSPSAPVWAVGLSEGWAKSHGGSSLINNSDPNMYRIYLRTPIVFVTTQKKAGFLRPLLSGPKAWTNLAELSAGRQKLPGLTRPFVWAHADPIKSNSGFLTLGLLLDSYVQSTNGAVTPEAAASSAGFASFLRKAEATMPLDAPVLEGSSALMKAFLADPDHYDVITTYESSALEAAVKNPDIAVLYPNPTLVSEQAVMVINGDWVTPEQKAVAAELLTFLGEQDSLRDGVNNHFRPDRESTGVSLAPEITQRHGQGFQGTFTSAEVPSYEALNSAAYRWNSVIGKK